MRVSIEHREKTSGFLRTVNQIEVVTSVQFTDEERAVIERRQLKNYTVVKREPDREKAGKFSPQELAALGDAFDLKVSDLMRSKPDVFVCNTPAEAKLYDQNLREGLKQLKAFIEANADVGQAKTFEL